MIKTCAVFEKIAESCLIPLSKEEFVVSQLTKLTFETTFLAKHTVLQVSVKSPRPWEAASHR